MMDAQPSPLVLTKLRAPAARARIIPRARLIDLLTVEQGPDVVLVCAPAGYGKTTLLAAWAQSLVENGTAVAWYALDSGDDHPISFRSYLIASFIQAIGPLHDLTQIAQRLRSTPELALQSILPDLINTLASSDQHCVLILDDYHLIRSPAIHSALAYLIEHLPDNLRIAIGSRSDPPLHLARLRARGRLLEIRTANLRFTLEEAAQFLHQAMRLDLSQEGINALEARTEGWIAGLQLASLALQAPIASQAPIAPSPSLSTGQARSTVEETVISTFTGSHRYLVDYLMEEVFNHQPEDVQSFLLATAILERMAAPLCDAILVHPTQDRPHRSEEILQQLEKANLFVVALDEQGHWYRYHYLFRDFLQARLNKLQPELAAALHRSAGRWLAEHGFLHEAAGHVFQTQDWSDAAAFVEQHSLTLIIHGEISTIYQWCSAFPEEVMQQRPMLCLLQGLALAYNFRLQNRTRVEARLRQANQMMAEMNDRQGARDLMEFAAVVRTFLAMAPDPAADASALLALTQSSLSRYPPNDPGQFSPMLLSGYASMALFDVQSAGQAFETARLLATRERLFFGMVESTFHMARLAHSRGQLRRAVEICRQGQAELASVLPVPEQELPALGCLDVAIGCVLLEQNHLDEADRHLRQGLRQMGADMYPHYLMTAYLALFRLYEILGRSAEAIKYLNRLEEVWPDIAFCTGALKIQHALRVAPDDPGARADAVEWCRSSAPREDVPPPGLGPIGAGDAYYRAGLAWMRAQIATGNARAAEPYLERQRNLASAHGLVSRVIELSLIEAELAAKTQADSQRALAALERALAAAQPEGYIRIFDQSSALTRLLIEAAKHGIWPAYLKQILSAIMPPDPCAGSTTRATQASSQAFVESLSDRELEVLALMAQGATNQAIADGLVITVGTVKSHINHILGKLGAQNRTEAVALAREAGLLKV